MSVISRLTPDDQGEKVALKIEGLPRHRSKAANNGIFANLDDGLVNVVVVAEFDESEALPLAGLLLGGAGDARHFAELKKNGGHCQNTRDELDHLNQFSFK